VARQQQKNGKPLLEDPVFGAKVAALEVELMALEITVLRVVSSEAAGKGPGPEASMLKIKGTEIQQMLTELMVEAVGPYAQPFDTAYLECEHEHSVTGTRRWPRTTSTTARRRSTVVPTKSKRTSSAR
jgi:acyl-CoA dehydrogenase